MHKYFCVDGFSKEVEYFHTEEQARKCAEDCALHFIDNGFDDYCEVEDVIEGTFYGKILGKPILETISDQTGEQEAYVKMFKYPHKLDSPWKHVEDELPEIGSSVICCDTDESSEPFFGKVLRIESEPVSDDFNSPQYKYLVISDQFSDDDVIGFANYWMPLPALPTN